MPRSAAACRDTAGCRVVESIVSFSPVQPCLSNERVVLSHCRGTIYGAPAGGASPAPTEHLPYTNHVKISSALPHLQGRAAIINDYLDFEIRRTSATILYLATALNVRTAHNVQPFHSISPIVRPPDTACYSRRDARCVG